MRKNFIGLLSYQSTTVLGQHISSGGLIAVRFPLILLSIVLHAVISEKTRFSGSAVQA
eukprot:SAG11_NODE_328_length_10690_cov_25.464357_3_plen_58_part_00